MQYSVSVRSYYCLLLLPTAYSNIVDILKETKKGRVLSINNVSIWRSWSFAAPGPSRIKLYGVLVLLGYDIAAFTPVAYQRGSLPRSFKEISSCGGFRAYMLSALIPSQRSYPAVLLAEQLVHQRLVQLGPLVLESGPLKFLTPTTDRDRTVSRRSEPSSRATLMGEQPNPWDLLQPQDVTSRHRGAKPPRRCELLGEISLLSPAYLLSFER